jgi:hypothetical protein
VSASYLSPVVLAQCPQKKRAQEVKRLRAKRAAPDYLAAERRRNRLRMRAARAENPNYGQVATR